VSEGTGSLKYGGLDFTGLSLTSGTLTLTSATDSSAASIEADLMAADYSADSVLTNIPVGYWWLTVKLGNASSCAIKSEIVHIYKDRTANITDSAVFTFTTDDFSKLVVASFRMSAEGTFTGTTKLTLTFSPAITGLTAANIAISPAGQVTTGALTETATPGVYELAISNVTESGTITVAVNHTDYDIASKSVAVQTPATLTSGAWADGNLTSSSREQWFRFTADAAVQYIYTRPIHHTVQFLWCKLFNCMTARMLRLDGVRWIAVPITPPGR
jgi:hypothetical protein